MVASPHLARCTHRLCPTLPLMRGRPSLFFSGAIVRGQGQHSSTAGADEAERCESAGMLVPDGAASLQTIAAGLRYCQLVSVIILCGHCGRRLTIPEQLYESRVRGRVVTIGCKRCGTDIEVDGTAEACVVVGERGSVLPPELGPVARSRPPPASGASQSQLDDASPAAAPELAPQPPVKVPAADANPGRIPSPLPGHPSTRRTNPLGSGLSPGLSPRIVAAAAPVLPKLRLSPRLLSSLPAPSAGSTGAPGPGLDSAPETRGEDRLSPSGLSTEPPSLSEGPEPPAASEEGYSAPATPERDAPSQPAPFPADDALRAESDPASPTGHGSGARAASTPLPGAMAALGGGHPSATPNRARLEPRGDLAGAPSRPVAVVRPGTFPPTAIVRAAAKRPRKGMMAILAAAAALMGAFAVVRGYHPEPRLVAEDLGLPTPGPARTTTETSPSSQSLGEALDPAGAVEVHGLQPRPVGAPKPGATMRNGSEELESQVRATVPPTRQLSEDTGLETAPGVDGLATPPDELVDVGDDAGLGDGPPPSTTSEPPDPPAIPSASRSPTVETGPRDGDHRITSPAGPKTLASGIGHRQLAIDPNVGRYRVTLPPGARALETTFYATVRVCVSSQGKVTQVYVIRSSGSAAVDARIPGALGRWRYRPWREQGKAVPFCYAFRYVIGGQ